MRRVNIERITAAEKKCPDSLAVARANGPAGRDGSNVIKIM